ncbi:endolytic transglycosylase MltG [Candidatus Kuenenbacteria bacterium]|nr:endolytic transglycosylase MltG [Candidatus Kuenenbacteria bacterium]
MKKIIFYLFVILVITGFILSAWFIFILLNPIRLEQSAKFTITEGTGVNEISAALKQQGIIKSSFVFETYAYLKDIEGQFKAGEYSLPAVVNIKRLVDILTDSQAASNLILLVKEGETIADIDQSLSTQGQFASGDFQKSLQNLNQEFLAERSFLSDKPASASLEGYLFPDTYYFFSYSSTEDIVRKMLANFDQKLDAELRSEISRQGKTIFEVITVASIIEREAKINPQNPSADANIISGIFWKRLAANMPLQADSTIGYVIGREPTAADLKIDSPYNTYLYFGLPPGPIGNPGLAAIKDAIYPEESDYFYFITEQNDQGTVHYAKTFEEHQRNIAEYLR